MQEKTKFDIFVKVTPEENVKFERSVNEIFQGSHWKRCVRVFESEKDPRKKLIRPYEYAVWEVLHSLAVRMQILTDAVIDRDTLISVFEKHSA